MKMVMITYNEAADEEVMEIVNGCGVQNYSKIARTYGKGTTSGTHMGTLVWPGLNNILYVACEDTQADQIVAGINNLCKSLGREGMKAFVMPVEQVSHS